MATSTALEEGVKLLEEEPSQTSKHLDALYESIPDEFWALASVVDVPSKELLYVAHARDNMVKQYTITTNKGKKQRLITAPQLSLKYVQKMINRNVLSKVSYSEKAHGFVVGRGILSNATQHMNADVVLNMDLRDFFPSIKAPRVYYAFRGLGFGERNGWLLTELCTYQQTLPQGFPTSPAIANLVASKLDHRLTALAASRGLTYTRYADDLTFSGTGGVAWLIKAVTEISADCGFEVHPEKIAVMRRGRRQRVTGLVVNDDHGQPRVPASTIDWLRSACFKWSSQSNERKREIQGWISYIKGINPQKADMLLRQIDKGQSLHG